MRGSCPAGLNTWSIFLQVWTLDRAQDLTYQLRSSELVTRSRESGAIRCTLGGPPITFSNLQNLTFQPGDVLGMYALPGTAPLLQPGVVSLNNDPQGALSDDIVHYLRVERSSVVEEVTFNAGSDRVTNTVPLISIQGGSGNSML